MLHEALWSTESHCTAGTGTCTARLLLRVMTENMGTTRYDYDCTVKQNMQHEAIPRCNVTPEASLNVLEFTS